VEIYKFKRQQQQEERKQEEEEEEEEKLRSSVRSQAATSLLNSPRASYD
jgi:hypothetical protein